MATKRKHPVENREGKKIVKLEDNDAASWLQVIPEELLDMILEYLSGADLLNLASCNHWFNSYIGSLTKFMQKKVILNAYKIIMKQGSSWNSGRQYESLIFNQTTGSEKLIPSLENYKNSIKCVKFRSDAYNKQINMLEMFSNLEIIDILCLRGPYRKSCEFPKLKKLTIKNAGDCLGAFTQCRNLEVLKVRKLTSLGSKDYLKTIIMNQRHLKHLQIGQNHDLFRYQLIFFNN